MTDSPDDVPPVPSELEGLVWWILDDEGRTPVAVGLMAGMDWVSAHCTVRVAFDEGPGGTVSTVFTPRMLMPGIRVALFETMVSPVDGEERFERWSTWDEALAGHGLEVRRLSRRGTYASLTVIRR